MSCLYFNGGLLPLGVVVELGEVVVLGGVLIVGDVAGGHGTVAEALGAVSVVVVPIVVDPRVFELEEVDEDPAPT